MVDSERNFLHFPGPGPFSGDASDGSASEPTPMRLILKPTTMSVDLHTPVVLLGRHSEAGIRLPLPDVSRRHCQFVYCDGQWHVQDLNSLNGTYLNGELIESSMALNDGDELRIGGFTFTVAIMEDARDKRLTQDQQDVLYSIYRALPAKGDSDEPHRRAS